MNDLLTVEQIAERLHVSRAKIYELTRTKGIPFYRVGRRCLFVPEKIEQWLESTAVTVEN